MRELEIRDVGPVQSLVIPVPEDGGIVVLRARNGAGKSHALTAVQALMGNGRPVSRDGSLGATIEGLGARLSIARRASRSGELEISHLEGEDPSLLVDPGLKSQEAADAERIRALCRLARVELDPVAAFADLVGGEERLREICRESSLEQRDLPSMAAAVKRDIESQARKSEQESKNLAARADGTLRALDDLIQGSGIDAERAVTLDSSREREHHESAVRKLSEAEGARCTIERLFCAAREASIALAELGAHGTDESVHDAGAAFDLAKIELDHAKESLQIAQEAVRDAERAVQRTEEIKLSELANAKQRIQLQRAIDQADGVEPISDNQLAELRHDVEESRARVESAAIFDRSSGLRSEARRLQEQAKSAEITASELRLAAQCTERIVTEAVSGVCPDDMKIHEGRLMVETESRGLVPFAELSQGERWRRSLDIAVASVGHGGLLIARQEAFEGLDPVNRAAIAEHAKKLHTVILTAEADEGELRAEIA